MPAIIRKVVFVSPARFDSNSAGHIAGFANGLVELGYSVAVCCNGSPFEAYSFGEPLFEFFQIDDLVADPSAVIGFDGRFEPEKSIILCWTPRETVRRAVEPIALQHGIKYLIHFEDNELHLSELFSNGAASGAFPTFLTDPSKLDAFLAAAAGVTVIEDRLIELMPPSTPTLVLRPGVSHPEFGSKRSIRRGATIRRALGLPDETKLIVYPGNVHAANLADVRALYEAVRLLQSHDIDVTLIRTGRDFVPQKDFPESSSIKAVQSLGHVDRNFLIDILKSADLFIQPGRPGVFDDYRLPSKLPEFMAVGRPLVLPATNIGLKLQHGVEAMLLTEGTPEEIAGHVESILADAELAARLSRNIKRFARREFRWDSQTRKLSRFLQKVA